MIVIERCGLAEPRISEHSYLQVLWSDLETPYPKNWCPIAFPESTHKPSNREQDLFYLCEEHTYLPSVYGDKRFVHIPHPGYVSQDALLNDTHFMRTG